MPLDRNTPIVPRARTVSTVSKKNKAAILKVLKAFNTGDTSLVDDVASKGMVTFTPKPGLPADRQGLKDQIKFFRDQFKNLKFEAQEILAEGDVVYIRWKMTGTHKAKFLGRPASNKRITHFGQEVVRFKTGKMTEHRDSFDFMSYLDKLGMLDARMLTKLKKVGLRARG